MIPLTCDHCDKKLRLRDELAGRRIKCPGCGGTLTVPLLDEEDDDMPPPKSKAVSFTPMKPSRARKVDADNENDDDDEDDDDRVSRKKSRTDNAGKPNPVFLVVGLILGLGGLVAMAACIVFVKQANDKLGEKQHFLDRVRADHEQIVNEAHKKVLNADIEKLENEIDDIQHDEVRRYTIFAVVCGIVFLVGFGIRGYYHVAMRKWHAETHGTGKKRKRDDDDDEDDDE